MADSSDTTNPSRRAILSAAPSVAAAAAVGVGMMALPMITGQDAEVATLLKWERRLLAAEANVNAQYEVNGQCARQFNRARAGFIRPQLRQANDLDPREIWKHCESTRRYEARRAAMKEDSGLVESEARLKELKDLRSDISEAVWKIKATCLESLRIKARAALICGYAGASALSDLRDL